MLRARTPLSAERCAALLILLTILSVAGLRDAHADAAADAVERGREWLARGETQRAIASFTRAIYIHPRDALAYALRGQALLLAGQVPAACADLDRAVALAPGAGLPLAVRAEARLASGEPHLALDDLYGALRADPTDTRSRLLRASLLARAPETAHEALADLALAIEQRPEDPFARIARSALLTRLERFDEALADSEQAIGLAPDLALAWVARARIHRARQDPSRALADAAQALLLAPALPAAMLERGRALLGLGRWAEAEGQLTACLRARLYDAETWRARAEAWAGLERLDLAAEDTLQAARLEAASAGVRPRASGPRGGAFPFESDTDAATRNFMRGHE